MGRASFLSVFVWSVGLVFPAGASALPITTAEPDPDNRIVVVDPFPEPPALRDAIHFWQDIFTRHPSDRVVVHDRDNMELVWRVVTMPKDSAGRVDDYTGSKLLKAELDTLRARLKRLSTAPVAQDEEDAVLLSLAGGDPARLLGAHERLRSQRGVADHFRSGLERATTWRDQVEQILTEEKVPTDIAVLPFVESMWNPAARSSAGAVGLWQLMPATAKGLGLRILKGPTDERLDILKATRAAARMLKQNYRMLGTWPLAITAYNHGPNGVRRAVQKVGSTDLAHLIERYEKSTWGFASKNFYAEFLAARGIMRNAASIPPDPTVTIPLQLTDPASLRD